MKNNTLKQPAIPYDMQPKVQMSVKFKPRRHAPRRNEVTIRGHPEMAIVKNMENIISSHVKPYQAIMRQPQLQSQQAAVPTE